MSVEVPDKAVARALSQALDHLPPFSEEECARLRGKLTIEQANSLDALQYCPNLRQLEIFASEIQDLDFLAALPHLTELRVACCPVRQISAITGGTELERIDLIFTLVESAQPLLQAPKLRYGVMLGNPWNDQSYIALESAIQNSRRPEDLMFDLSNRRDWGVSRQLAEKGIGACYSQFNGEDVLVVPGAPRLLNANCDFFPIPFSYMSHELAQPDFTIEGLFDKYFPNRGSAAERYTFDYLPHFTVGNSSQAAVWVESSTLAAGAKQSLNRFTERFPSLVFYREDSVFLARREEALKTTLPEWFKQVRQVLAFVQPHELVKIQFDRFEHGPASGRRVNTIWYEFGLIGLINEDQRPVLEEEDLFVVADWAETPYSTLCIRVGDPPDERVYQYAQDDLDANGRIEPKMVEAVFDSYASMIGHITALQIIGGPIVQGV